MMGKYICARFLCQCRYPFLNRAHSPAFRRIQAHHDNHGVQASGADQRAVRLHDQLPPLHGITFPYKDVEAFSLQLNRIDAHMHEDLFAGAGSSGSRVRRKSRTGQDPGCIL